MGPSTASTSSTDPVDHIHYTLDFAAEIGMTRGVDDIDRSIPVEDSSILGEDGDTALALEIIGVEHSLGHLLIGPKHIGLTQHAVHQRSFAMVDMRNDSHVADVGGRCDAVELSHQYRMIRTARWLLKKDPDSIFRIPFHTGSPKLYPR